MVTIETFIQYEDNPKVTIYTGVEIGRAGSDEVAVFGLHEITAILILNTSYYRKKIEIKELMRNKLSGKVPYIKNLTRERYVIELSDIENVNLDILLFSLHRDKVITLSNHIDQRELNIAANEYYQMVIEQNGIGYNNDNDELY